MDNLSAGFSQDDLLAIGTRKAALNLPLSATDINRALTFEESKELCNRMTGLSDDDLKAVGAGKAVTPAIRPEHINQPPVTFDSVMDNTLSKVQSFLGYILK